MDSRAHDAGGERTGYGTVQEVATYLNVSHMTIYRLMNEQKLAFAKFGRARRIAWSEVARYERASTHGTITT